MQPESSAFSTSAFLALASEALGRNGYNIGRDLGLRGLPADTSFLAEDDYSVVAVVAYDTWDELEREWPEAQAELVSLLGRRLARSAPKAWDGYLVLLCTSFAPNRSAVDQIERDTTRIRKIVATADNLTTTSDVLRLLDIFMPLELPPEVSAATDILDTIPDVLDDESDRQAVRVVIEAFREAEPPLERLHALGKTP